MERTIRLPDGGWAVSPARTKNAVWELWNRIQSLIASQLGQSVAWIVIGSGFSQGGSFLSSVVVARVLGKETFGQFALIQSTVTALTSLAGLGLGLTATKYISEFRAKRPENIGKLLGFSSILVGLAGFCFSIASWVLAPKMAVHANDVGIVRGLRLSAPSVFFLTLTGYQLGTLAGFEAFRFIGQVGVLFGLAALIVSWLGAVGFGLPGAVVAQDIAAVLLFSLYGIGVHRECRRSGIAVQYRGVWNQRSILSRVSIPATMSGTVCSLAIWGTNTILAKTCGYSQLALFIAAYNLRSIVIFVPALISRVAAPRLNFLFAAGDLSRYARAFWATVRANGLLAMLTAFLAFLGAHRFMLLFGKEFGGSSWLLALILGSAVVEVTSNNLYIALMASCKFWRNLAVMSLWTAVLACTSALTTMRLGASGLAIAYLAAWSVSAAVFAAEARGQTLRQEVYGHNT